MKMTASTEQTLRELIDIDVESVGTLGAAAITMLQQAELTMMSAERRTTADFNRVRMLRDIVEDLPPSVVEG